MDDRTRYFWVLFGRWSLSISIALLFPIQLMVGAVQHDVAEKMSAAGLESDFGLILNARANLDAAEKEYDELNREKIGLEARIGESETKYKTLQSRLAQAIAPEASSIQEQEDAEAANALQVGVMMATSELALVDEKIKLAKSEIDKNRALLPIWQNVNGVRQSAPFSWLCGTIICPINTPPVIMPFFLIFSSGFFGAILFQMILLVYPNSEIGLVPGTSYSLRVLLGGVIAMALFVVLASGSAILGSSEALFDGRGNIYALSSIGILAGMFSDRVAGWLSGSADSFLSRGNRSTRVPAEKQISE